MPGLQSTTYLREHSAQLIIEPLDSMTVIYYRRSGMTHIVAEPVPQILASMDAVPMTAADVARSLATAFDIVNVDDTVAIVAARLEELADLGLVERVHA